jgi:hypothetical protein
MAYGCRASLEHAVSSLDRLCSQLAEAQKENRERGDVSEEQRMIVQLAIAVGYVADSVRYLKDGVP